MRIFVSEVLNA